MACLGRVLAVLDTLLDLGTPFGPVYTLEKRIKPCPEEPVYPLILAETLKTAEMLALD